MNFFFSKHFLYCILPPYFSVLYVLIFCLIVGFLPAFKLSFGHRVPCIREWTAVFGPDYINKGWNKEYDSETTEICQPPEIFCSVYNIVYVRLISLVALSQCGKLYKSSSRTVFMENVDLKDFCINAMKSQVYNYWLFINSQTIRVWLWIRCVRLALSCDDQCMWILTW